MFVIVVVSFDIGSRSKTQTSGQFPVQIQTKYFDFRCERNSPQAESMKRFGDGYVDLLSRDFFTTDYKYPIRVFVLQDQPRLEEFVHRELHVPGPAGYGIFLYQKDLLATYEKSGLGTFAHETMHAFVMTDLPHRPAWADEGIPTFFEKFYGYWKDNQLAVFWGFQNPWRVQELGDHLTQLDLADIISNQSPETNESELRMVSLFLWHEGKFKRFLRLISANDKRGYNSFLEGAMELPLEQINPLWRRYLLDVEQHRTQILSLPVSAVFDNEAAFQEFVRLHGISTEQVRQDD